MVGIEYANAYSEVLEILKYIPKRDYEKIPKEKIELFEANKNQEYSFNYTPDKTLEEQQVSKKAKVIIAILFRDYWATDKQKEKIIAKEKYDRYQMEIENNKLYDVNNIFKNKNEINKKIVNDEEKNNVQNMMINIKKENIFRKIANFIKGVFGKDKK